MAGEYLPSDVDGLVMIAELRDDYYRHPVTKDRIGMMAELRLQEQRFGLSPIDRRRLQWEVERGDEAEERTTKRRETQKTTKSRAAGDPRALLRAVK